MLEELDARTALIYAPVREELTQVEHNLRTLSKAERPQVAELLKYLFERGGKGLRPALTLLSAKLHSEDATLAIIMASAVELLHIATLIHDDAVDHSALRRGRATVSDRWGQNVAVLLGDYVFATSATFVCATENVRVIRRFSQTIMELSSGQLLEHFSRYKWDQRRGDYEDRIFRKTASLFRTSAESGAVLGMAPEAAVRSLSDFGNHIGMAFQIVDDILDLQGSTEETGKPVSNDLLQGVLTLPAIMLLERYPDNNPIKELFAQRGEGLYLEQALDMIKNSTIIDNCFAVAEEYCARARQDIGLLRDTPCLRALLDLTSYVTERRR